MADPILPRDKNIPVQRAVHHQEKAIDYDKSSCPLCGADSTFIEDDGEEDCFMRYKSCPSCGGQWTEVYGLVSIYITEARKASQQDAPTGDGLHRLFAAAPELLAVLAEAAEAENWDTEDFAAWQSDARAAITKAKGEEA